MSFPLFGSDLAVRYSGPAGRFEDGDLHVARTRRGHDLALVTDVEAAEQFLVDRIKTQRGELAPLGHPTYGSRHHELIGQPNVQRTRNLIKLYVLQALADEPRIEKVLACVVHAPRSPRGQVRIELELRLIDEPRVLNLVVPFSLESA